MLAYWHSKFRSLWAHSWRIRAEHHLLATLKLVKRVKGEKAGEPTKYHSKSRSAGAEQQPLARTYVFWFLSSPASGCERLWPSERPLLLSRASFPQDSEPSKQCVGSGNSATSDFSAAPKHGLVSAAPEYSLASIRAGRVLLTKCHAVGRSLLLYKLDEAVKTPFSDGKARGRRQFFFPVFIGWRVMVDPSMRLLFSSPG